MRVTPHSGFQDRRHRPLGEPSWRRPRYGPDSSLCGRLLVETRSVVVGRARPRTDQLPTWGIMIHSAGVQAALQVFCWTVPRMTFVPGFTSSTVPRTSLSPLLHSAERAELVNVRSDPCNDH